MLPPRLWFGGEGMRPHPATAAPCRVNHERTDSHHSSVARAHGGVTGRRMGPTHRGARPTTTAAQPEITERHNCQPLRAVTCTTGTQVPDQGVCPPTGAPPGQLTDVAPPKLRDQVTRLDAYPRSTARTPPRDALGVGIYQVISDPRPLLDPIARRDLVIRQPHRRGDASGLMGGTKVNLSLHVLERPTKHPSGGRPTPQARRSSHRQHGGEFAKRGPCPVPMHTIYNVYTVNGMTCRHCAATVSHELSSMDNVTDVAVNLATGAVTVTSADELSHHLVEKAVANAGYQLVD